MGDEAKRFAFKSLTHVPITSAEHAENKSLPSCEIMFSFVTFRAGVAVFEPLTPSYVMLAHRMELNFHQTPVFSKQKNSLDAVPLEKNIWGLC